MTNPTTTPGPVDPALQARVAAVIADAGGTYPDADADTLAAAVLAVLAPELARAESEAHWLRQAVQTNIDRVIKVALDRDDERRRAEQAEAALDRVKALADLWDRDAPPPGNRPLTELRIALTTPATSPEETRR